MCRRIFNDETSSAEEIPFFKIGSFGKVADAFISKNLYLDYKNRFSFPKKGDILISAAGTIGRTVVYNGEDAYYQDSNIVWIDNDNTKITNEFLYHILQIVKYNTEGGTIQRLYNNILKSTKFSCPSILEQNKISTFLNKIEERIQTQKKIIEQLKTLMKASRENIFSQKLRFKNENDGFYSEWKSTKLKNITQIFDGTHQTPKYIKKGVPFYSVENVTANNFSVTKYISEEVFTKENNRVKIEKGDILMTRIGDIGTVKYIDWDVNASFYVSLALIKKNNDYHSKYLAQYISSNKFQNELWNRTIHVAFPKKINLGEIGECLLKIPCIEEQKKIANFLFSIQEKIELEKQILEKLELQKKCLLANLFV
jgi:type I restriction enzyme S subunit